MHEIMVVSAEFDESYLPAGSSQMSARSSHVVPQIEYFLLPGSVAAQVVEGWTGCLE